MRLLFAVLTVAAALAATPAAAAPGRVTAFLAEPSDVPAARHGDFTVNYRVARSPGVGGLERFRDVVAATLADERGWNAYGAVAFEPGRSDAELTIWLASPGAIVATGVGCSAHYSCRVGDDVYVNARRWREGAESYGDESLGAYRRHVINHEVGHWLGLGHRECSDRGAAAPVMQQQSKGLDGCQARAWPLPREQAKALDNLASTD